MSLCTVTKFCDVWTGCIPTFINMHQYYYYYLVHFHFFGVACMLLQYYFLVYPVYVPLLEQGLDVRKTHGLLVLFSHVNKSFHYHCACMHECAHTLLHTQIKRRKRKQRHSLVYLFSSSRRKSPILDFL